jgi:hypothetical protein
MDLMASAIGIILPVSGKPFIAKDAKGVKE